MRDLYSIAIKWLMINKYWEILLCKENNWYWDLPWGWMSHLEKYDENIKREIKEEMWLDLDFLDDNPSYFFF